MYCAVNKSAVELIIFFIILFHSLNLNFIYLIFNTLFWNNFIFN